jgi:phage tail protein X
VRILLGALLLVALFLAATTWQRRFTAAARTDLAIARGRADAEEAPPEGWSVVTVGRPSGGERFEDPRALQVPKSSPASSPTIPPAPAGAALRAGTAPSPSSSPSPAATAPASRAGAGPLAPAPPAGAAPVALSSASEWIVEPGQSLSRICAARYGTARAEVVEAVARHNGLADAGLVREGQRLRLPPIESLLPRH